MKKENIITEKAIKFSLNIIDLYKILIQNNEYIISKQLLKSSTSIGANLIEGQNGESRKDFIHKLGISLKEAHETKYWIYLLHKSQLINLNFTTFQDDIDEIIKILTKIIKTTKSNTNN
jgi:four helix bundle protein